MLYYPTGELQRQINIGRSLIKNCVRILQALIYITMYVRVRMTTKLKYLMTAYYTPNDRFTANDDFTAILLPYILI